MSEVWVVETGDYEDRHVFAVAASPEVALAHIRKVFGPPYVVAWDEPIKDERGYAMAGHFEGVLGYSVRHTAYFSVTPEDLVSEA